MNRCVTSSAPAGALPQIRRVIRVPDVNLPASYARALHLSVALQAKIEIVFDQHLPVDRPMRVVANGASFAQRFMLKNKRTGLFPMTRCATFIQARHCQTTGRFENVAAVRIMALHTIDPVFDDGMMMR